MSLSQNLLGLQAVVQDVLREGRVSQSLGAALAASIGECARQAADMEGQLYGTVEPTGGEVIDLRAHIAGWPPTTMGGLLGPSGRVAEIIPLPVVRIERHSLPGGEA